MCCDQDFPGSGYHTNGGMVLVPAFPHCILPCPNFLHCWNFVKINEWLPQTFFFFSQNTLYFEEKNVPKCHYYTTVTC